MNPSEAGRTLTTPERLAVAAFFLVAVVIASVVVLRVGSPKGDVVGPIDERPMVDSSLPRPVTLLDAYAVASMWARQWHEDAWPILVSAMFEYPEGDDPSATEPILGYYLFTFAGPKDGDEWPRLTLAVSRQSGTIYHEDELTSGVEPPDSIDAVLIGSPISAEQAYSVADEVVGEGYREGCGEFRRQIQVALDTTVPDTPRWTVVYFDQRERGTNDIVVRIDAQDGGTTTEVRDDPSCEMQT